MVPTGSKRSTAVFAVHFCSLLIFHRALPSGCEAVRGGECSTGIAELQAEHRVSSSRSFGDCCIYFILLSESRMASLFPSHLYTNSCVHHAVTCKGNLSKSATENATQVEIILDIAHPTDSRNSRASSCSSLFAIPRNWIASSKSHHDSAQPHIRWIFDCLHLMSPEPP